MWLFPPLYRNGNPYFIKPLSQMKLSVTVHTGEAACSFILYFLPGFV